MFGLRRKKPDEDFGDIRSSVLSTPADEDLMPRRKADLEPLAPRRDVPDFADRQFGDEPRFDEPPGFGSIDVRAPPREPSTRNRDYDIVDRLNLIESQIAAVRSMTETINERLKNMEHQLPRRGY